MSAPFRDEAGAGDVVSVGAHRLKGFADPVELSTIVR
jgi:adenylate cyclase